ncbi:MAG: response regulator [Desulfobacteraceae bacterium]|nr:response regulator [Desulfobacteraceae bacterium]
MKYRLPRQRILIVDDVPMGLRVLVDLLTPDYEVSVATSGPEALELAVSDENRLPDLILLDIVMPVMDGYEVCRRLKAHTRTQNIPVIFITSMSNEEDETRGLEMDVADYIRKPFSLSIVKARIKNHLELKRHQDNLDDLVKERTAKLERILEQTVDALKSSVEIRDPYTSGHQERVSRLACAIAAHMGLSEEYTHGIRIAGRLHDIGKISIPAEILTKPGRLNEIEFRLMKEHSRVSYEILKDIEFSRPIAKIVLQHHERLNGSGYPLKLQGKDILLEARILSVADVVEAMSTHRPYRPAIGLEKALEEIMNNKGILYDPEVAKACYAIIKEKGFVF